MVFNPLNPYRLKGSGPDVQRDPGAVDAALRQALKEAEAFCSALGIDLDALIDAEGFEFTLDLGNPLPDFGELVPFGSIRRSGKDQLVGAQR